MAKVMWDVNVMANQTKSCWCAKADWKVPHGTCSDTDIEIGSEMRPVVDLSLNMTAMIIQGVKENEHL